MIVLCRWWYFVWNEIKKRKYKKMTLTSFAYMRSAYGETTQWRQPHQHQAWNSTIRFLWYFAVYIADDGILTKKKIQKNDAYQLCVYAYYAYGDSAQWRQPHQPVVINWLLTPKDTFGMTLAKNRSHTLFLPKKLLKVQIFWVSSQKIWTKSPNTFNIICVLGRSSIWTGRILNFEYQLFVVVFWR